MESLVGQASMESRTSAWQKLCAAKADTHGVRRTGSPGWITPLFDGHSIQLPPISVRHTWPCFAALALLPIARAPLTRLTANGQWSTVNGGLYSFVPSNNPYNIIIIIIVLCIISYNACHTRHNNTMIYGVDNAIVMSKSRPESRAPKVGS